MSRHILTVMFLLASATSAIGVQVAAAATGTADVRPATNAATANGTVSPSRGANAKRVAQAEDAISATSASKRDAREKSDAAAKRQAKSTPKASDDAAKADATAKTDAAAEAKDEVKTLSGISILGNQEAPKSLVIVPWKSSEIGEMPGLSRLLDDSVQPIDKEVFMRELDYYEIRSGAQ